MLQNQGGHPFSRKNEMEPMITNPILSEGLTKREKNKKQIEGVLNKIFSDIHTLYVKTQSYHWNVVSHTFKSDHELFGSQYEFLFETLDGVAERMRAIGLGAPSTFEKVEAKPFGTDRESMFEDLSRTYEGVIMVVRMGIHELEICDDVTGADYLTGLLAELEKNAWMIDSSFTKTNSKALKSIRLGQ